MCVLFQYVLIDYFLNISGFTAVIFNLFIVDYFCLTI